MKFNEIKDLKKYHLIHHDELIEKNIVEKFHHNQYDEIDVIVEFLNKFIDVELYNKNNNEIIIYDVDEFDVDEILNDKLIKYDIVKIDDEFHEIHVVIDPENFQIKKTIENYDELLKYFRNDYIINELIENTIEYKYIYNHSISMNLLNDYYNKNLYLYRKFMKLYEFDDVEFDDELLIKFKKIFDDEFIDDIEIIENLNELYVDVELYKNYDIELFNDELILINHSNKTIKNLNDDELYNLISLTINKYLKLNNNVEILHDEIIELLNIISYEFLIVEFQDQLYKINLTYDYNYKISGMKKIKNFIDEIDDINEIYQYHDELFDDEIHDVELIQYDDIIELFNIDDVIEFIDDDVEIDVAYYNYENYVALNNLFYRIFKKYHMNIDEKIYDNIRKIRKIYI